MPAVTVRFLGLAAMSAIILLNIPNTRAIIHIGHLFSGRSVAQAASASILYAQTDAKDQYIPKIIHRIYQNLEDPSNDALPADWDDIHDSCTMTNPDFEYRLWTANSSRQFIETHYGTFLETYDCYQTPAERVNTLRYFVMRHYGGIYLHPMYNCSRHLEPLLWYPAWVLDNGDGIMGARPEHPYWVMMTESLMPREHRFRALNYPITYTGGSEFETAVWKKYHAQLPASPSKEDRVYRIKVGSREDAFFTPNGTFNNNSYGYNVSAKALLGCLLLFAMLTSWLARSWQARKTHQREYQKLLPVEDVVGGYGAV